ncbi:hypothetical protein MJM99_31375, partial [Salmonella enterica subsp. enterica serovar Kentucky]|nr:hypothetical protein [Salmonella enterica subsp. enterica serovar Kentucky]
QNIHLQTPERIAGDSFRARETGNLFVFCLPCRERFHVNTGGVSARQAFWLCGQLLAEAGQSVVMENPGYPGARQAFSAAQLNLLP